MTSLNFILGTLVKQALGKKLRKKSELEDLKRNIAAQFKERIVSNSAILKVYQCLVEKKKIKVNSYFERLLKLKKTRTISGVTPLALFTKPFPCPGECVYCPIQKGIPKSYLDDEPAVMRAIDAGFSPRKQVINRIKALDLIGHPTDKIELIVMGGTFSALPKDYRVQFVIDCLTACNGCQIKNEKLKMKNYSDFIENLRRSLDTLDESRVIGPRQRQSRDNSKFKILRELQKENEAAPHRLVGVTFETRPDFIDEEEVRFLRILGGTRIELGVQSIDDDVLRKVGRGHGVKATIKATKLLKDAGFKVCYHLMPNLPGSTSRRDLAMFRKIFSDPAYCPDMIKIYPCVVTLQAPLYKWYKEGRFKPYSDEELVELIIKIKQALPEWVRVNRLGRDIPIGNIAGGTKISNIRQVVQRKMKKRGLKCQCIRCREIRAKEKLEIRNLKLRVNQYQASRGREYFLQYVDKDNNLYALLRLRILGEKILFGVLKNSSVVRELHTYGPAVPIKKRTVEETQHRGLGKALLKKAEEITKKEGLGKISVISGVGARDYYRQLGYRLVETFMVKYLR